MACQVLSAMLVLAGVMAGCGGPSGGGYSLNPPGAGFMENSGPSGPGVPIYFPAYLPKSQETVRLVSARLLPLAGFAAPRLVHLGVWHIFHGLTASGSGWPPHGCGGAAPCNSPGARFAGFELYPGEDSDVVYFWVVPPRPGNYYVAGLKVTYRVGSGTYTGDLFSGGLMCVRADWRKHGTALAEACQFSNKADAELTRLSNQNTR